MSKLKCNYTPQEILQDTIFYLHYDGGKLKLRKDHPYGCYAQIQITMGLSHVHFCDFVVFTFKGMITVKRHDYSQRHDNLFEAARKLGLGGGEQKASHVPKICHTYPIIMKFGTVIPYLKNPKSI